MAYDFGGAICSAPDLRMDDERPLSGAERKQLADAERLEACGSRAVLLQRDQLNMAAVAELPQRFRPANRCGW